MFDGEIYAPEMLKYADPWGLDSVAIQIWKTCRRHSGKTGHEYLHVVFFADDGHPPAQYETRV